MPLFNQEDGLSGSFCYNNSYQAIRRESILKDVFDKFIKDNDKPYRNNSEEYNSRFGIFKDNLKKLSNYMLIVENGKQETMDFGITKFFDLTPEEFKKIYLTNIISGSSPVNQEIFNEPTVKHIDWRSKNVVTKVKNQENCGACWAFTFVELVESMTAIGGGSLMELSPQQILDCTDPQFSCALGGNHCLAAQKFQNYQIEVVLNSVYPYKAVKSSTCQELTSAQGALVTNHKCFSYVTFEDGMIDTLSKVGPLAVAVDATMWQFYSGGIIQYHCGTNLNHAVVIVGYDLTGPIPYYIVRNSWGEDFGHDGYLYIAVGNNVCGVASSVLNLRARQA